MTELLPPPPMIAPAVAPAPTPIAVPFCVLFRLLHDEKIINNKTGTNKKYFMIFIYFIYKWLPATNRYSCSSHPDLFRIEWLHINSFSRMNSFWMQACLHRWFRIWPGTFLPWIRSLLSTHFLTGFPQWRWPCYNFPWHP